MGEGRYNHPSNSKGMQKDEEAPKREAEKTAGDPPSNMEPKGAIHKGDDSPSPKEQVDGDGTKSEFGEVAKRHMGERKEMLAAHRTEHEHMIARHAEGHMKMAARHESEMKSVSETNEPMDKSVANKAGTETGTKADGAPKLGKPESKGNKGSEP